MRRLALLITLLPALSIQAAERPTLTPAVSAPPTTRKPPAVQAPATSPATLQASPGGVSAAPMPSGMTPATVVSGMPRLPIPLKCAALVKGVNPGPLGGGGHAHPPRIEITAFNDLPGRTLAVGEKIQWTTSLSANSHVHTLASALAPGKSVMLLSISSPGAYNPLFPTTCEAKLLP